MNNIIKQIETRKFSILILQKVIYIQKFWRRKKLKNKHIKKTNEIKYRGDRNIKS